MKKGIIFLYLIYVGYLPVYAQSNFEILNPEKGFPSTVVWAMLQDSKGFMWFGTQEGLIRYDGVTYKLFYPVKEDSTQLSDSWVHYLYEDNQGKIWISLGVGDNIKVHVYDPVTESFTRMKFALAINSFSLQETKAKNLFTEDTEGNMWISGDDDHLIKIKGDSSNNYNVTKYNIEYNIKEDKGFAVKTIKRIGVLFHDSKDRLWVGTWAGRIYRFDKEKELFIRYGFSQQEKTSFVTGITEDKQGLIWVCYLNGKLICIDPESKKTFTKWSLNEEELQNKILYMVKDKNDNIWMLNYDEQYNKVMVDQYNIQTGERKSFLNTKIKIRNIWDCQIQIDNHGTCIVYANNTFYYFNDQNQSFSKIAEKDEKHDIINFYVDEEQNIWFGSIGAGVAIFHSSNQKFNVLRQYEIDTIGSLYKEVYAVNEDSHSNIWVGHLNGLDRITLDNNHQIIDKKNFLKGTYGRAVEDLEGNIWTTKYYFDNLTGHVNQTTLVKINPKNGEFNEFLKNYNFFEISDLHILKNGSFLLSSIIDGLIYFDPKTNYTKQYMHNPEDSNSISGSFWIVIEIDQNGNVWVANQRGLDKFYPEKLYEKFIRVHVLENSISGNISDMLIDSKNRFWVLANGLYLLEQERGRILKRYTLDEGLPTLNLTNILEDDQGRLWIASTHGLICFNTKEESFTNFTTKDGLPTNFIMNNSEIIGCKRKNGELMFRSSEGIVLFHPDSLPTNTYHPCTVFTEFRLFNEKVNIDGKVLSKSISYTDEIILNHDQNVISFTYSALSFANPSKNQYAHFMEGVDKDWNYVGNQTFASYAGLPPGEYTLNLKASNNDGLWNETPTTLAITILPPWWQTGWAYALYGLFAVSVLLYIRQYEVKRVRLRQRAAHLSEMDTFKSRFYTNITHEFRTPLTVILGIADQIGQKFQNAQSMAKLIKRNGLSLLHLVNQMLELSKLEAGMLTVTLQQGNIIPYIRYIVESFHSMAEHKDIHLHFRSEVPDLVMDYDADKVLNIVSNLLSNAIKFTPEGGHVSLVVSQIHENHASCFLLRITDTGMGIPVDQLPHIFDRFYQGDSSTTRKGEGTGIGLSLTKELIQLLGGTIAVKSTVWQGTEFTVVLPVTNTAPLAEETKQSVFEIAGDYEDDPNELLPPTGEKRSQPVALIVEDNVDVVYYLRTCLQGKYTLEVAQNGQDGIDKALEKMPDIIISDIMMPEKNGYELCETLKNHEKTSHIPIILLTAKAAEADKIEGLTVGADAYLTKPFNKEELKLRIKNLIAHRKKLWSQYNESFPYNPQELEVSLHDQQFLTKALEILEGHKSDPDFSAENLQKELGVSRTLLHVKLKALTGQSTTEFIRTYRLKYAAQLIRQHYGNIAQVAYEAGFNDQSYFTKSFKKHFGVAPSEYAKSVSV